MGDSSCLAVPASRPQLSSLFGQLLRAVAMASARQRHPFRQFLRASCCTLSGGWVVPKFQATTNVPVNTEARQASLMYASYRAC
jgi:hypothetical protein